MTELQKRLKRLNNNSLAKKPGMVFQAWSDGEITLTKSGDLLGRRNLHTTNPPLTVELPMEYFPHNNGKYGYCYTTSDGSTLVRDLVRRYGK